MIVPPTAAAVHSRLLLLLHPPHGVRATLVGQGI